MAGSTGVTAILLLFGMGTFIGSSTSSVLITRSLPATLTTTPLLLSLAAIWFAVAGGAMVIDSVVAALWGVLFGIVPVAWSTWLTRIAPDETESGGGLVIATTSLAITLGAAGGGVIFDHLGVRSAMLGASNLFFSLSW